MRGEQGIEAGAQRRGAFAIHVEKCSALPHRFFQRQRKQRFFAIWIPGCLGVASLPRCPEGYTLRPHRALSNPGAEPHDLVPV